MSSKNTDEVFHLYREIHKNIKQSRLKHGICGNFYTFSNFLSWIKTIQYYIERSNTKDFPPTTIEVVKNTLVENPIHVITTGKGAKKVLLWARMHGDEPTATKSLIDFVNFITAPQKYLKDIASELLEYYTFIIIPILNPDGMEKMDRYTVEGIDMNRDALALQTEGGQVLNSLEKKYKPAVCFNLHDQQPYYSAGNNGQATSLAFLAPPTDAYDTYTENRHIASRLISSILPMVCKEYPNSIAKWNSDFEPLAFGEYMQQQGSITMLIESGFNFHDLEKEKLAEMNFSCILTMLYALKNQLLPTNNTMYKKLPVNEQLYFDFIVRGVQVSGKYVDIAFNIDHKQPYTFPLSVIIEEIGDLSSYNGHLELNKIIYDKSSNRPQVLYKSLRRNKSVIIKLINPVEKCITIDIS